MTTTRFRCLFRSRPFALAAAGLGLLLASAPGAFAATSWGARMQAIAQDLQQGNTFWAILLFIIGVCFAIGCVIGMNNLGRRNGNGSAGGVIFAGLAAFCCIGMGALLGIGAFSITGQNPDVTGQAQQLQIQ